MARLYSSILIISVIIVIAGSYQTEPRGETLDEKPLSYPTDDSSQPPPELTDSLLQQYNDFFGMNFTSLSIASPKNSDAILRFTNGGVNTLILALLAETGSFVLRTERFTIIEATPEQDLIFHASNFVVRNIKINGDVVYNNMPQWRLAVQENFWTEPQGWNLIQTTVCGGLTMLGGYCVLSTGEIEKLYVGLPRHRMLRVKASFHFIDAWTGETAYMKLNIGRDKQMEYVWTEKYDSMQAKNGINVCGGHYPEGKLTTWIDVTVPHTDDSIRLAFGATVDQDPCDESWGISNIQMYVR